MKKIKVITVFGTRPEGIKMAPIIKAMEKVPEIENTICITAQHRQMLDQVLNLFKIEPDYDLNIFKSGQTLTEITMRALEGLEKVILEVKPDILLVQGDTSTVFSGLWLLLSKGENWSCRGRFKIGNLYSPYPEEANRKLTGILTDFHFALQKPTDKTY